MFIGTVCAKGSSMPGCMGSHMGIWGEPSRESGSEYMVLGREPYELTESWSLPMKGGVEVYGMGSPRSCRT